MLRKSNSKVDAFRGFIFIPLVIGLIFVFACSETNDSDRSNQSDEAVVQSEAKPSKTEDEVFIAVESMPKFQGGSVVDFRNYVQQQLSYPEEAAKKGLEGTSFVQFIINKEGEVEDVEVKRSSHPILDQAAVDIIENSPQWEAGKQRGEKVKVQFTIPIVFKLSE